KAAEHPRGGDREAPGACEQQGIVHAGSFGHGRGRLEPSLGPAVVRYDAAGAGSGNTTFGGWVPSALRRLRPLATLRTCLAEMVLFPTRFFFDSAMVLPSTKNRGYMRNAARLSAAAKRVATMKTCT